MQLNTRFSTSDSGVIQRVAMGPPKKAFESRRCMQPTAAAAVVTEVQSPPPQTTPKKPITFLGLPSEIHIIISEHLPESSIRVLILTPNHRLSALYTRTAAPDITPSESAIFHELITRDAFERTITPHFLRWGHIRTQHMTSQELDVLRKTRFYCHGCDKGVNWSHFPVEQIALSIRRKPEYKIRTRRCVGACTSVRVGRRGRKEVEWWMLERTRDDAHKIIEREKRRLGDSDIEPFSTPISRARETSAGDGQQRRETPSSSSKNKKKKSKRMKKILNPDPRMARFLPEEYTRLECRPVDPSPTPTPSADPQVQQLAWTFTASTQSYTPLAFKWSESLAKNLHRIRATLLFFMPYLCKHMSICDILFDPDADFHLQTSLFRYMVASLHNEEGLPWEDEIVEADGTVVKRIKSMLSECFCVEKGCRTEVVLQRAKCLVRKAAAGGAVSVGKMKIGRRKGKGEKWKEVVWLVVRRKWVVDTPSESEWRMQLGLEGCGVWETGKWNGFER